ncbi:DUF7453 family protein [Candidatus Binatus sp.]|uniref:DUF7453 family protein n=1 Tax=Candidatus Binatus sp. TaxID=2811406 RepID=UPI003BB1F586
MFTPRLAVNVSVALALAIFIGSARAYMLGLDGSISPGSDVLYALDRDGREVRIAQTGSAGPDWVVLEDLGTPSIALDGTVLFGAAREWSHQLRWSIFVAEPDSGSILRVTLPTSSEDGSYLDMVADPRPQRTSDGGIVFLAHESSGDDALFKLAHGKLKRLIRTGERLSDGHTIRVITFGSIRPESQGGVAFLGYLEPGGQAEMMVSEDGGTTILALQDTHLPDSERFRSFGLPAATVTADGPLIAFTARTDRGAGLFTFAQGTLHKALSQSASCGLGHIDYLSPASPGLNDQGALAVLGRCSGSMGIFMVKRGTAELVVNADHATDDGTRFDSLGDPVFSEGTVFFGALTADGATSFFNIFKGKITQFVPTEVPERDIADRVSANPHTIEVVTMSINQHGQMAYLGSP